MILFFIPSGVQIFRTVDHETTADENTPNPSKLVVIHLAGDFGPEVPFLNAYRMQTQ